MKVEIGEVSTKKQLTIDIIEILYKINAYLSH